MRGLPTPGVKRATALLACLALAAPAGASAHATLIRTEPRDGAVLAQGPASVRVFFDDTIRVAADNAAVDNASLASILAAGPQARGRVLTIPLRAKLAEGDYSVRWSIVSDDGHREQGVLAFAVGLGRAAPQAVLGTSTHSTHPIWSYLLLRVFYYGGILAAAGATVFALLAWPVLGDRLYEPLAQLLFVALLLASMGAYGLFAHAPPGSRIALLLRIAILLSVVGGAAAAVAITQRGRRLLPLAAACSVALVVVPTLSGHALDRDQPWLFSVPIELGHAAAAAVWLGGLLALVSVLPAAAASNEERTKVVRRFSTIALGSVVVLAISGLGRAVMELGAVSQIWSTPYGRVLIVKSALFVPLLALGWLNRTLLLGQFPRLRRSAILELVVLLGIVVAVAVLTELGPAKTQPRAVRANTPLQVAEAPGVPAG